MVMLLLASAVWRFAAVMSPPVPIVKSVGSRSHVPPPVLTLARSPMVSLWPEVSTLPPAFSTFPDSLPPLASISPSTRVTLPSLVMSDHSTALPPLPLCVALTSIFAPCSMVTVVAWCRVPLPCQSPPTSTVPPPVVPLASSVLPLASVMWSPSSTILPPLLTSPLASIVPLLLITALASVLAARALKITCPPSACTRPLLSTSACTAPLSTAYCKPLASTLSVTASAPASSTCPMLALMSPSLRTSGASSDT